MNSESLYNFCIFIPNCILSGNLGNCFSFNQVYLNQYCTNLKADNPNLASQLLELCLLFVGNFLFLNTNNFGGILYYMLYSLFSCWSFYNDLIVIRGNHHYTPLYCNYIYTCRIKSYFCFLISSCIINLCMYIYNLQKYICKLSMSFKKMTIHTTFVFVLFNVSAMIRLFYLNIWINQISRQNVKHKNICLQGI